MRHFSDDEEYSQQVLDKSTEIWSGAAKKRQIAMQSLTPGYSRKKQVGNTSVSGILDKQLEGIKEKISSQKSATKQKDLEIQTLKERIAQLNKDKQVLLSQIGTVHQQSWERGHIIRQNTLNFEKTQMAEKPRQSKHLKSSKSQIEETIEEVASQRLEDLPSEKLLELLRSTTEYRNFVEYYDSQDLIFLHELFYVSKRINKPQKHSGQQWLDAQIMNEMSKLNEKQNLGLNYHHQTALLARIKEYYDRQYQLKAKSMRNDYQVKVKKAVKEASIIPEDLKEMCKLKEGQLAHQVVNKRGKSTKKKLHH